MSEHCIHCGKRLVYEVCECEKDDNSEWFTATLEEFPDYLPTLERIAVALENLLHEVREIRVRS